MDCIGNRNFIFRKKKIKASSASSDRATMDVTITKKNDSPKGSIVGLSLTPPPEARWEDHMTVDVCGFECLVKGYDKIFYCTRTAVDRARCGHMACREHLERYSRKVSSRWRVDGSENLYMRSIAITNLDYGTNMEELWTHFKDCGDIYWINIVADRWTGKPTGYAFMTFSKSKGAKKALLLTGSSLREKTLGVAFKTHTGDAWQNKDFTPPTVPTPAFTTRSFSGGLLMATDRADPEEFSNETMKMIEDHIENLKTNTDVALKTEDVYARSIMVDGIYGGTMPGELWNHFMDAGDICWMHIIPRPWTDAKAAHQNGYAYITYTESASASRALILSGSELKGSIITVTPKSADNDDNFFPPPESTKPFTENSFSNGFLITTEKERLEENFRATELMRRNNIPKMNPEPAETLDMFLKQETPSKKLTASQIMDREMRKVSVHPVDAGLEKELWCHFKECGDIRAIVTVLGSYQRVSIIFADPSSVQIAVTKLNGSTFQGREIQVSPAMVATSPLTADPDMFNLTKVIVPPRPAKEDDFIEHLKYTLDVFPEPNAIANLIAIGKFVAEGGDLSSVGDHQGLSGCTCIKCDIHKKLMTVGTILAHAHMVYEDAESSDDSHE